MSAVFEEVFPVETDGDLEEDFPVEMFAVFEEGFPVETEVVVDLHSGCLETFAFFAGEFLYDVFTRDNSRACVL